MSCWQRPVPLAEPELQEALRRLVEAGLVFQRGAPPAAEYLFKHALVQDTAYSTMLRGPRQALHRRIAEALEQRFPDLAETRPEILAHHYGEAAMPDKAITYWHRAGKLSVAKCVRRSRNCAEASVCWTGYPKPPELPIARSHTAGNAPTLALTLYNAGMAAVFARDVATVHAYGNDCVAIASEHGFANGRPGAGFSRAGPTPKEVKR
jgi:hypothetical protein